MQPFYSKRLINVCYRLFYFLWNSKKRCHTAATNRGCISLSEHGRHVARLRRRRRRRHRRAYAPTSNTASHHNHEKINWWVSFSFLLWVWSFTWRIFGSPEALLKIHNSRKHPEKVKLLEVNHLACCSQNLCFCSIWHLWLSFRDSQVEWEILKSPWKHDISHNTHLHSSSTRCRFRSGLFIGNLSKPRRQRQRERHQAKDLMSRAIAMHVNYKSFHISLLSSAEQGPSTTYFGERRPRRQIFHIWFCKKSLESHVNFQHDFKQICQLNRFC